MSSVIEFGEIIIFIGLMIVLSGLWNSDKAITITGLVVMTLGAIMTMKRE